MKIVIVGAGRVGYAIAEQLLTEGHDITVVESDPERAAYISSTLDVIVASMTKSRQPKNSRNMAFLPVLA